MTDPYKALFRRTTLGIKPGLDVITGLLQAMGNPHQRLAAVHVAGTNGKGSVCAMIESTLRASGFKTGLYTSPHLVDFSERFRINGVPISRDRLAGYIRSLEETADRVSEASAGRPATFFEISTAIAFQYFADEQVDIAIIETGMGGRWDATNVLIPLVSVITRIDLDHADYLGDTIEQVAAEKAGIIKPGRPVVSAPQCDAALAELEKVGEPLRIVGGALCSVTGMKPLTDAEGVPLPGQRLKIETPSRNLPPIQLPLAGVCQRENCAVAVTAVEVLAELLDFEPAFKQGLESTGWNARFQLMTRNPPVILDVAHNPAAARALVQTIREQYPHWKAGFILGFLDDKDIGGFLQEIRPSVARAWTVSVDAPRGAGADRVAQQAELSGFHVESGEFEMVWKSAQAWADEAPDRLVCVTGTLYLAQMLAQVTLPSAPPADRANEP